MNELLNEEMIDSIKDVLAEVRKTPDFRFALIGSRETDTETCEWLNCVSKVLMQAGGQGYSGGAEGADEQLTNAVKELLTTKEYRGYDLAKIFIGWYKFNGLIGGDLDGAVIDGSKVSSVPKATKIAQVLHPAFDKLKPGAKALHTRNCFQILDEDLNTPVDVVFYAANQFDQMGRPLGGTATAWKLATALGIPTFNCALAEERELALQWTSEHLAENKHALDIFNQGMMAGSKNDITPSKDIDKVMSMGLDDFEDPDIDF